MFKGLISTLFLSSTFATRYIVTLKEESQKWMDDSIVDNKHMKPLNTKKTNMVFVETDLTPEEFTNENVLSIEEDKIMKPLFTCQQTWGLDRINEVNLPLDGVYLGDSSSELRGDDVDVYVIDTGIKVNHNVFSTPPTWLANFGAGINDGLVVGFAVVIVGLNVGLVVGFAVVVGLNVGLVVGFAVVVVGLNVGLVVGFAVVVVGLNVGLVVGLAVVVGFAVVVVGLAVGFAVLSSHTISSTNDFGGQHSSFPGNIIILAVYNSNLGKSSSSIWHETSPFTTDKASK